MCESTVGRLPWLAGGPRKKRSKYVDVCTFNSSGRPQLMDALNHCRRGRFTGPRCSDVDVPVAACLNQEHHARGDEWVNLKMSARKAGWNLVGAMAELSKGSQGKAGAAIATRTAFHTGLTKGTTRGVARADRNSLGGRDCQGWHFDNFDIPIRRGRFDNTEPCDFVCRRGNHSQTRGTVVDWR